MSRNELKENRNSKKVSYKVSLGGIVAALCLVMMFLTAVIPPLSITLPLFAGMLISVVAIEVSPSWALVTYLVVSILSFFITPDKEAAVFFAALFGYYPILKSWAEKIKFVPAQLLIKLAAFNVSLVVIYQVTVKLLGTVDLFEEFGFMKQYMLPGLLVIFNIVLFFYDFTLGLCREAYVKWFRTTFLRKFK